MQNTDGEKLTISAGEIFRWQKGLRLRAIEEASFILPGALFRDGERIGDILDLSDDETKVLILGEPKGDAHPDMAIILKSGETMQLNRNCEVIHIHLEGETPRSKDFVVVTEDAGAMSKPF